MIHEILMAFILIFIAEMGDKTQILAMAFATRFPVRKVLLGIGIGAFLNHGLAVLLGSYLSSLIPVNTIQMVAGAAFVGFALWTLKSEEEEEEEETKIQFGPVATVSIAFFLGELGDKTQLTAITLAADSAYPALILAGTVSGMIATGALGIFVGKKLGDRVPELAIKLFASAIFLFFGIQKLLQTVPETLLRPQIIIPVSVLLGALIIIMIRKLLQDRKAGIQSEFLYRSKLLHDYYAHVAKDLEHICMGPDFCKNCQGNRCAIGRAKNILANSLEDPEWEGMETSDKVEWIEKPFKEEELIDSLVDTIELIETLHNNAEVKNAKLVRNQLEQILFGSAVQKNKDLNEYFEKIEELNKELAQRIETVYKIRRPLEERLIHIGNRINNSYLVEMQKGYLLIDTGYEEQFEQFEKALKERNILLEEIQYIFVTHVHDDHVGYLKILLSRTKAKVILHKEGVERLKKGINSFQGGCSGIVAFIFCKGMNLVGKGSHKFSPVDAPDRYLIVDERTRKDLEDLLMAKIIDLPGHTKDSIGLLYEGNILFCGDAAMNGIPSRNHIIIWIENLKEYKKSWEKMMNLEFKKVYPAHGRPFSRDLLKKDQKKLEKIHLYSLTK